MSSAVDERQSGQMEAWRQIYDADYAREEPEFSGADFAGWVSTYDGKPIAAADMREWRAAVTSLAMEGAPERVLEIGCGTGMFTATLAGQVTEYRGTDLSPVAVDRLSRRVAQAPEVSARVTLHHQAAHDTTGLPAEHFDLVLMNSVVQYFPDGAYLLTVLRRAAGLLRPGGRIVVSDVRDLRTLRTWLAAVWTARTGGTAAEVRERADHSAARTNELLLDPAFFATLPEVLPQITFVEIRPKRGRSHNEITRHRYDVVLHTTATSLPRSEPETVSWDGIGARLDGLARCLRRTPGRRLRVTGVPDGRLLTEPGSGPDAGPAGPAEPEDLIALGDRLGRPVRLALSPIPGLLDAVVGAAADDIPPAIARRPDEPSRPPSGFCNDPVRITDEELHQALSARE